MTKAIAVVSLLLALFVWPVQDPPPKTGTGAPPAQGEAPPPPPEGASPLPAVEEPYVSPVPRLDLLQQFARPDPIEGCYELRTRVVAGVADPRPTAGWLTITRRHLSLYLIATGPDPRFPLLRSGVRRWRRLGDTLHLTVLAGHLTDEDGDVALEQGGTTEVRRVALVGATLRLHQDSENWLEFVRIE